MLWLLDQDTREALERAYEAGVHPSADQQIEFEVRQAGVDSRIMAIAGNTAEISIRGVLTPTPNFMAYLFGGGNTTYPEIVSAIAAAEQDPNVKKIEYAFDSAGGSIDGMFDAVAAMKDAAKPSKAIITNKAASAAYALASQADEIVATNRAARVGSIGVATSIHVSEDVVDITSTNAPKKRPDVTTKKGQAIVREELDAFHELFADAIAEGRSTTADKVNADFGQGATLLAEDALKRGMIDSVAGVVLKPVVENTKSTAASGGNQKEAIAMDLSTLRTEHPVLFEAVVQTGVDQERDRVCAHLTMGQSSGDMETATEAIKNGDVMTASLQATYMAAGINRRDVDNREIDDTGANAAAGATPLEDTAALEEKVVAGLEDRFGIVTKTEAA